jgi:hypothetical protein
MCLSMSASEAWSAACSFSQRSIDALASASCASIIVGTGFLHASASKVANVVNGHACSTTATLDEPRKKILVLALCRWVRT